ncbi:MFS transporter [Bacillus sp. 31A1R]|uniref:MFS transporter n=1 Tax=Robertmurraya mangrovi TaxID=3098077 RepID=A0ABU5IWP0_9BACI|nr:MFS transporter [Bacillus sp. 31A1R]MDZ5471551.1 MFS transporter [Bacillus sp. 31A1R]
MNKFNSFLNQFHIIVWVLLLGTVIIRCASTMTLPFLAIYLSKGMDIHPLLIGLTIGMSPLMATVGGFVGGNLSDKYGRKPVMLTALFLLAFVFFGFTVANHAGWFILLNALNGLCNSFFEPTSQALMADLTDKKNRLKAYSYRYTAINIGASVGPLVGAYLAMVSAKTTFIITSLVYLFYGIILFILMNRLLVETKKLHKSSVTFVDALNIVRRDKALGFLILGGILINIGYGQLESNLPQHLDQTIANSVYIYSVLLSINAVMVVFLQIPISHIAEKYRPMQVMIVGAIFLSLGLIGFSFVNGWVSAILAIALLTIGEILIFPSNSILIDQLASEELRGTYFGAGQFRKIGHFVGPIMGGFFLSQFGGQTAFWIISIISISSIYFFTLGNRAQLNIQTASIKG